MTTPEPTNQDVRNNESFAWLLSRDPYRRVCLRYWLITSRLYLILISLQAVAVSFGMMSLRSAGMVGGIATAGIAFFYVAIRTGFSKRMADPAMTVHQVSFGLLVLAVDYALAPQFQSLVLTVTPLGLLFGAFTLSAAQCRALGVVSVVMLAAGMVLSAYLNAGDSSLQRDLVIFLSCAAVYTMVASMAGRLSKLRSQLREQKRDLAVALERNNQLARQDELTGLPNRRQAHEMMEYEERRSAREALHPCVCLMDIDHFKSINDTYGHPAGDEVLRTLARHAPQSLRAPDLLARWGGEEFLLVMPQTTAEVAMGVTDRLRTALGDPHVWAAYPHLQVTFSAGVAVKRRDETIEQTVARADAALYRAKQAGRNCTMLAND